MGYNSLGTNNGKLSEDIGWVGLKKDGLEVCALRFIRENCTDLRYDDAITEKEKKEGVFFGTSTNKNQIPYNMQMDIERLCLENAVESFLKSGRKQDAFDVYFCYLEMFFGQYNKTRRIIELLSEFEANGSGLLMKHRDHYAHSVYVFSIGLAIFESNSAFRDTYKNFYKLNGDRSASHHFLKYWGFTSLLHDIGYPFELPFEQVCSYFEVDGDDRRSRPYMAYHSMDSFVKLDKSTQRKLAKCLNLDTNKILRTTDEFFAYVLSNKLSDKYYFSEEEMLQVLTSKPTEPNKYNHFMDHAYFSATVLFKRLFCELDYDFDEVHIDALTAILIHNSIYKFSIAYYKDMYGNIPLEMDTHPLAYMLMLCDELQCWDRTAYGRNTRLELYPMGCSLSFSDNSILAEYIYDDDEAYKMDRFEAEYEAWEKLPEGKKKDSKPPKLKAYSEMFIRNKDGISKFTQDIGRIVSLSLTDNDSDKNKKLKLRVKPVRQARITENNKNTFDLNGKYLSDSNFINLYNFAVVLNGRWSCSDEWAEATTTEKKEAFLAKHDINTEFAQSFDDISLEYKLSNINQAKAFAKYLSEIDCFYTNRDVDYNIKKSFTESELRKIGPMEHYRWIKEHLSMGWSYIPEAELNRLTTEQTGLIFTEENKKQFNKAKKGIRERLRLHNDMPSGIIGSEIEYSVAKQHFETLSEEEKNKDMKPMECMLVMLKMYDGLRIYTMKPDENND